jgi:hypothetical protein
MALRSEIASLYVAQFPADDTSREVAARFEVPMFASIREALTLGTSELAVDGVLLIVEHGDYPLNSRRQKLYPRFEWFQQIVEVFRDTGRVCPVWIDKALSWNPEQARQIVETAREMKIPLMAGSSLPHAGFSPPFNWQNEKLEEVVALFYGGPEIYGFHSLELVHSLMQRCGGVQPVSSIEVLRGEEVWQAMDEGQWSRELFDNALSATHQQESGDVRDNCRPNSRSGSGFVAGAPAWWNDGHNGGTFAGLSARLESRARKWPTRSLCDARRPSWHPLRGRTQRIGKSVGRRNQFVGCAGIPSSFCSPESRRRRVFRVGHAFDSARKRLAIKRGGRCVYGGPRVI